MIVSDVALEHYQACDLCPRVCGVNRANGEVGICGATDKLVLGRAALHWWEEPCLVGEQGSGAVFFSYCPMKCVYCQNYDLAHGAGVEITSDRLRDIFLELQNEQHAANINLVTPTHYLPHIAQALTQLRTEAGDCSNDGCLTIPVVYNTSGFERVQALSLVDGLVDVYLTDFKYSSVDTAQKLSRAKAYPETALLAVSEMLRQTGAPVFDEETGLMRKGVIVRHLVLPGHIEESFEAVKCLWEHFGNDVVLSIMGQYTPLTTNGELEQYHLNEVVTPEQYERVLEYADSLGVEDYFWQEGGSCEESFIPAFDGTGVMA